MMYDVRCMIYDNSHTKKIRTLGKASLDFTHIPNTFSGVMHQYVPVFSPVTRVRLASLRVSVVLRMNDVSNVPSPSVTRYKAEREKMRALQEVRADMISV